MTPRRLAFALLALLALGCPWVASGPVGHSPDSRAAYLSHPGPAGLDGVAVDDDADQAGGDERDEALVPRVSTAVPGAVVRSFVVTDPFRLRVVIASAASGRAPPALA